jgi:hypothetical protein
MSNSDYSVCSINSPKQQVMHACAKEHKCFLTLMRRMDAERENLPEYHYREFEGGDIPEHTLRDLGLSDAKDIYVRMKHIKTRKFMHDEMDKDYTAFYLAFTKDELKAFRKDIKICCAYHCLPKWLYKIIKRVICGLGAIDAGTGCVVNPEAYECLACNIIARKRDHAAQQRLWKSGEWMMTKQVIKALTLFCAIWFIIISLYMMASYAITVVFGY